MLPRGLPGVSLRRRDRATPGCSRRSGVLLAHGAWVDVQRNWLHDPDDVFAALVDRVPWRAERREMYDAVVDVPRLVHTYLAADPLPHPALTEARDGAQRALPPRARRAVRDRGLLLLPRRPRLGGVARRHHRPRPHRTTRWSPSSASATPAGCCCARAGGGASIAMTMGHGDLVVMGGVVPAHLGARRAQGRPLRTAAVGPVPPAQRLLITTSAAAAAGSPAPRVRPSACFQ